MADNIFEAQYDISKKSKIRKFYDSYKTLIYSFLILIVIIFGSFNFYLEKKEKDKILLSENYFQAKVYLQNGNKSQALDILKNVVMADDSTYSLLSLFLILNQNLIDDNNEVSILFNHLLENNKFDNEIKSLLIYKKALFDSNFANESELLKTLQPILNSEDNLWRPHALLLIGDYFSSKKEHIKAKEFYMQVLSIKNLDRDLYYQASSQIELNNND